MKNESSRYVDQHMTMGTGNTQIGVQNNHIGMTAQEAVQLAINLFMDNFPKLQEAAQEVANQRIDEFCSKLIENLKRENVVDFTPFTDPDVQYVLYEAQKNYARFGSSEMLSTLIALVTKRITYCDDNLCLKVSIDEAANVVNKLESKHLDLLSMLFICKQAKFSAIHCIEDLKAHYQYLDSVFSNINRQDLYYLDMFGCLKLDLSDIFKKAQSVYGISEDIERDAPESIQVVNCDYSASHIGTMLAIINAEQKSKFKFDPKIWVK